MNDDTIIYRTICGDNGCARSDATVCGCLDQYLLALLNLHNARSGENMPSAIHNHARKSIQILQRMELRLPRKSKYSVSCKFPDGHVINTFNFAETRPMRRLELVFQIG